MTQWSLQDGDGKRNIVVSFCQLNPSRIQVLRKIVSLFYQTYYLHSFITCRSCIWITNLEAWNSGSGGGWNCKVKQTKPDSSESPPTSEILQHPPPSYKNKSFLSRSFVFHWTKHNCSTALYWPNLKTSRFAVFLSIVFKNLVRSGHPAALLWVTQPFQLEGYGTELDIELRLGKRRALSWAPRLRWCGGGQSDTYSQLTRRLLYGWTLITFQW